MGLVALEKASESSPALSAVGGYEKDLKEGPRQSPATLAGTLISDFPSPELGEMHFVVCKPPTSGHLL